MVCIYVRYAYCPIYYLVAEFDDSEMLYYAKHVFNFNFTIVGFLFWRCLARVQADVYRETPNK